MQRVPRNNGEIERWFRKNRFEVVEFGKFSLEGQIAVAREARIIVGLHGSNLTNVMFMQQGACVVELMPVYKRDDDAYQRLASIFGLSMRELTCRTTARELI